MAPSSFKKIGAAVAYAAAVRAATESYILSEEYTADNFFEKFDFFESTYTSGDSWDDTHGYVRYRTQADAESLGLISTSNGQIYLGPDTNSTYDPDGKGRDSIRMTSKATYNQGLMIATFSHLPVQACGAWPAFWSFADPWLTTGEIDYYEGWDLVGYNRIAMHTNETLAGSCTLTSTGIEGKVMTEDCNQVDGGAGCGVKDDSGVWGSVTGATFAMEWTDSAIKIWNWLPSAVPADVAAGSPDPSSGDWGSPTLLVEQTNCDLDASFANQQLVFDIDFCGDTAGSPTFWNATCSAFGDSCAAYVAENPAAFSELYFMVEGIQFYEMGVAATTSASSSAVAPATTSATSSALLGGLVPGLGSVLDSTIGATATLSSATSNTVLAVAPTETHSHSTGYVYATSTSTDESGSETTVVVVVDTTICPITASEAAATSSSSPATGTDDVVAAQSTPAPAASSQTGAVAVPSSSAAPSPSDITLTSHLTSTSTEMTTSTIFSTSSSTITSCASTASASCSVGQVTTVVIAVSTTICPVTAAEASSSASANGTTLIAASSTGVSVPAASGPAASGPAASSGSATSGNSPVEATPAASSGTGAGSSASSTITTTKSKPSSSSAATTSINPSSTEVISTTDVSGELETASGTLVLATATATGAGGAYNAGAAGNGTATAATAATSATQSNTCSGLDCIVVSNGAGKTGAGAGAVGASGIALVVLAGAMFLF